MLKYSLKRILLAFITAFIILTMTFFLVKSLPPTGVISPSENVRMAYYLDQVALGYVTDRSELTPSLGKLLEHIKDSAGVDHYFYQTPIVHQYFRCF